MKESESNPMAVNLLSTVDRRRIIINKKIRFVIIKFILAIFKNICQRKIKHFQLPHFGFWEFFLCRLLQDNDIIHVRDEE